VPVRPLLTLFRNFLRAVDELRRTPSWRSSQKPDSRKFPFAVGVLRSVEHDGTFEALDLMQLSFAPSAFDGSALFRLRCRSNSSVALATHRYLGLNAKVFCRGWEARPRLGLAPSRRCLRAGRIRKAHLQVVLLMKTSPLDVSLMFAVACAIFGAFSEMAAPQLCSLSALTKDCSYGPAGSRREFQRGLLCHNPSRYGTHSLSPAPLSHSPQ
jgi:hypothetical protein